MQTTMSSPFPPEILDLIVDPLHNEPAALKTCCAVSKSWVPRSRKLLFASVEFRAYGPTVESWMNTFPDPLNSPTHYTRTLRILDIWPAAPANCLRAFRNIVRLKIAISIWIEDQAPFVPFHGLWPDLRSLHLGLIPVPPSEVPSLVCSFPLLEDLALRYIDHRNDSDGWNTPSASPKLTGSLELEAMRGICSTVRRLLDLPNGPPPTSSFDLSTATKLKDLVFQCTWRVTQWITMALRTIKSENLQRIALQPRAATFVDTIPEPIHQQEWEELDRLLVQFWISHSIRPQFTRWIVGFGARPRDIALGLMPELARRGLVDKIWISLNQW